MPSAQWLVYADEADRLNVAVFFPSVFPHLPDLLPLPPQSRTNLTLSPPILGAKPKMRLFALTCLLSCLVACQSPQDTPAERPPLNVVWINVEDISPALGCYGDPLAHTPNLDRLARQGVVYRQAYSTAPICAPSRSSFITGVYSTSMGTQHLRSEIERPDFLLTLPEHLKRQDYFTTNYGKTDWNFAPDGAFDYWEQELAPWRQRPDNQPFFSMFVLGGTHEGAVNKPENYQRLTADLPDSLRHDPTNFPVPDFYPQTPEFRRLMAHYYDLISQMDRQIGEIMTNLEEDGLMEHTAIFFFADHGYGLPWHKRYLYRSGTHVPLLVYLPESHHAMNPTPAGQSTERLVSLVDLLPSTLSLLGIKNPDYVQGQAFLGKKPEPAREYVFVERSRADDLFDMSRGITDGRYLYVRNYMPYLPYTRPGRIQADAVDKLGYSALKRMHQADSLPPAAERLFHPKPVEELYDWQTDPDEVNSLAQAPAQQARIEALKQRLRSWSQQTRDIGFLPEPEYMIRGQSSTPYQVAQDPSRYDVEAVMASAERVGSQEEAAIRQALTDPDGGVAYWAVIATRSLDQVSEATQAALQQALTHESPSVQIAAAEALCSLGSCEVALPVLDKWVQDERPWLALQAARSAVEVGPAIAPIVPTLEAVRRSYLHPDPDGKRTYRDFTYASFIGWALEQAIAQGGE
jgi:arylsulfatase A-like enzyme